MAPGPELAAALARIDRVSVSNGDLVEVLKARYRLQAHVAAQLAADIAALGGRDPEADPREIALVAEPGRYVADELRVALSWTRRKSDAELEFSWLLLSRLPLVFDALDSGWIDLPKARIFATYLADLPDAQRTEICQAVLPKTPPWTTGKLAANLRKLVIGSDPDRAQDLYEKAFERRSVVGYLNEDGTATLSASGIAPEDMAAACTRVNALARAIKRAGHPDRVDQIRADVFCGLLDGTLHGLDRAGIVAHFRGEASAGKPQGIEIRAELATLLNLSERPGELPGWGPILAANTRRTVLQQRGGSWTFAVCDEHGYLLVPGVLRSRPTHATRGRAGGAVELQLTAGLLAELVKNPPPGWERVIADIANQCAAWPETRNAINARPNRRFPTAAHSGSTAKSATATASARAADAQHGNRSSTTPSTSTTAAPPPTPTAANSAPTTTTSKPEADGASNNPHQASSGGPAHSARPTTPGATRSSPHHPPHRAMIHRPSDLIRLQGRRAYRILTLRLAPCTLRRIRRRSTFRETGVRIAGRRPGPAVLAVGLALVAVLVSSCAVGPSSRPPVAVRGASAVDGAPEAPPPPPPAHGPTLPVPDVGNADEAGFLDCTEDIQPVLPVPVPADRALRYECSDVPVDSDYSIGRRRQSSIGLMRVSLSDQPPDARPPLLVLGDSDGETGTLRAARLAAQVPLSVLQHFTLVGMDRRGEGTSRLDCAPPDTRSELVDADLTGTGQAGVDMLLEEARKAVQECSLTEGDTLTKYDTADTAGDIEHARQLLGVRTLGGIGLGDGARAMAVWAQQSPASVGRLVLDSPPDPTQDAIGATDARASASEATFDAFARDCQSRANCPLGTDARATLTSLAGQLRARPISGPDGELLTSGAMLNAVLIGLDDPSEWPDLASSIGAARNGDAGGLLRRLDQLLGLNGRFDLALATRCNDTAQRVNPPQLAKLIEKWQTDHPLFGSVLAQQLLYCSAWPVPTDAAKEGPATSAPPMLVLATALSPRVPSQGYQRAADQLAPATLVNWQGAGRGAYPRTTCVTNAVDSLWVQGTVPQASVLCPP